MDSYGIDPLDLALAPNPSGDPPNFIDPPSLEPAFLGVGISLMVISSILVTVRIYTNYRHTGKLYIDDYLCLAGWASSIIYWAFFKTLVDNGTARHVWDVPASIITPSYARRLLIQQIFGNIAMWAVKACIQALFIRIFDSVRWMRIASYLLMISTGILYVAAIIIWCIYCTPRANEDWGTSAVGRSSSRMITALVVTQGVVGLLVDILMFAMPFPIILRLQLQTPKKLGLTLVFAVAFCTVVSACASLAYRIIAYRGARGDLTWVGMNVFITSLAELFGAVIVSCAPSLSSFWHNICKNTRLYSRIHPRYTNSTKEGDKEPRNGDHRQFTSEENLRAVRIKNHDPYPITDVELASRISSNEATHDELCSAASSTSVIVRTTHRVHISETL